MEKFEIQQLKDILAYLEDRIIEIQLHMNKPEDHGFLRIAVSDYNQTKLKFEECKDSEEAKQAPQEVQNEIQKLAEQFKTLVAHFEAEWSQEVQKIAEEQEEPSRILVHRESNVSRVNELTSTAIAMQSQKKQDQSEERPFLNLSVDAENKILAEVALDNKNYKSASIQSTESAQKSCCACRCQIF